MLKEETAKGLEYMTVKCDCVVKHMDKQFDEYEEELKKAKDFTAFIVAEQDRLEGKLEDKDEEISRLKEKVKNVNEEVQRDQKQQVKDTQRFYSRHKAT